MTNAEVIQTMTVAELNSLILYIGEIITAVYVITETYLQNTGLDLEAWLRADSQEKGGLLTDELKKYWKVH